MHARPDEHGCEYLCLYTRRLSLASRAYKVQSGFSAVVNTPQIIYDLIIALHTPNLRLRVQIADLLSALCVLSAEEGRRLLLDGFSEAALHIKHANRFEWLIRGLIPSAETESDVDVNDEVWEWRTEVLILFNALAGASALLEERCDLRGELHRRGLNEILGVSSR